MVADFLVVNGDIRTMDALKPRATALAARDGRILATGSNAEMRALAGPGARIVDAGGRLVLPGFQDTHIHLLEGGTRFSRDLDLSAARTPGDITRLLAEFVAKHRDRPRLKGHSWYAGVFNDRNLTREILDAAVPDKPVLLYSSDYHSAIINSAAIAEIGLDRATADPENGYFSRDKAGEATGMLNEAAITWATDRMPETPDSDYEEGVLWGQAHANRHGFTGILDALVTARHLRIYDAVNRRGQLTLRVASTALVEPEDTVAGAIERVSGFRRDYDSPLLKVHSAKFFLDGVFENRTAAMIEDYKDALGGNAPVMFGENHLRELFIAFDAARFQIHVHVIGDKAAQSALDALEAARAVNSAWPSLHQLAHVQVVRPEDIPRFAKLGVMPNIQPLWARSEPSVTDVAMPMCGPEMTKWIYPFRSLIDAGATCAMSSDWGVSTLNPFHIMQTAITRQPPEKGRDHPVFLPEQRMSLDECIKGYTTLAAAAAWRSADTGSLEQGKYADLIVLDRNLFEIDVYDIHRTEVMLTVLAGKDVWRHPGFTG
ncbi:MAG: amidohydrolase [Alphaproteobacteria bacterium]|nr:amidohydrolase [Alphaproteobacteria bacterium]